jgi:hypothetical protein
MIFRLKVILILTTLAFSSFIKAQECNETCKIDAVNSYFDALDKVAKKGSTEKDVDALLALMHDNVNYVHVEYKANFDKASWRKAFLRNLKLARYQNTEKNQQRIIKHILGKNYIAVEYSHGVVLDNGQWQATEPLLALFGFTDGKISLIKELW